MILKYIHNPKSVDQCIKILEILTQFIDTCVNYYCPTCPIHIIYIFDRVRTHVVKFFEGYVLALSRKTSVSCSDDCPVVYVLLGGEGDGEGG